MTRIYPFYHRPEAYPEFEKRPIRATTRETLENTVQFMSLRDLPHPGDGSLQEIEEALDLYTKRFELGKVFWMRANAVSAPNLEGFLRAAKRHGGYVFDLWGFVPGSYKKGLDWGEYTVTDAQHRLFAGLLGDRFIGYDNGEQDGRYIGAYTRTQCPARQQNDFQQRRFYEFFDEMGAQLQHATTALASLNYVHFFARENNCFMLGAETAQALPNANLWYSFIRGAGKQYGLLWFGNASVYNRFSWKSYDIESPKVDKEGYSYGPNAGTSLSLLRRLLYVEYLYNSDMLGYESGLVTTRGNMEKVNAGIPLEPNQTDSDKSLFTGGDAVLSPIGRLQADCVRFVKARGYAGPMYTPVAVVLNSGNGWCTPRHLYTRDVYRAWGQLPYTMADYQLHALFSMLYPGYEDSGFFLNERGFLTPTPYGETMDVLMTDMRPETLGQYNVAILGGWQKPDCEQLDKFEAFARQGGTLLAFAGQIEGREDAAALFGAKRLGNSKPVRDARVCSGARSFREEALSVYAEAELDEEVQALAWLEDGTPLIVSRRLGEGRTILVLSPYGMNERADTAPVRNVENASIPKRYELLESVRALLADLFNGQLLVRVDNPALETIVNLRGENTLTVTAVNNALTTEAYQIELLCGREVSRREIEIPDVDPHTPGYWPMYSYPHAPFTEKADGQQSIGPGQIAMWEIEYEPQNVTRATEVPMRNLSGNVYVSLRPGRILIEELQNLPMLDRYFAGVKLDASYVSDISLRQAKQSGSWLRRRRLEVIVDFAPLMDHYPHFSLIRNMPEKQDAKLVWMGEIMDKAVALGASRILLGHHRNAENHLTADEAAEQMRATIGTLAEMARERGLRAVVSNAVPFAVKGGVKDVRALYADMPHAIHLAHCALAGEKPDQEDLLDAEGILLSAPLRDEFGQMIDAHLPLYSSELRGKVTEALAGIDMSRYAFVCLDGVYESFDEMYLERKGYGL